MKTLGDAVWVLFHVEFSGAPCGARGGARPRGDTVGAARISLRQRLSGPPRLTRRAVVYLLICLLFYDFFSFLRARGGGKVVAAATVTE